MNAITAAFLLAGIQTLLVVVLVIDRWVHRVTGPTSLEARVTAIEAAMALANTHLSKKMSDLTVYLEERRGEQESVRADVRELQGQLIIIRDRRRS